MIKKGAQNDKVRQLLLSFVSAWFCLQAVPVDATPALGDRLLVSGKSKMASGHTAEAISVLESAVKASPNSCEAHLYLGEAYCKVKNLLKARDHFRAAIRVGQGSANAQKANRELMNLPKNIIAPRANSEVAMLMASRGMLGQERGAGGVPKPVVMDFYATWCKPCKQVATLMEKAQTQYGSQVAFLSINVDDPDNQSIVDGYGISPIPTLVFLNSQGDVVSYSIGFAGDDSLNNGIKKILAAAM